MADTADGRIGESPEERGERHARIAAAYYRQLLAEGFEPWRADKSRREYMLDLLFAEIGQNVGRLEQRRREELDGEDWKA